jgi:hypothetical protein
VRECAVDSAHVCGRRARARTLTSIAILRRKVCAAIVPSGMALYPRLFAGWGRKPVESRG